MTPDELAELAPFPRAGLTAAEWDHLLLLLLTRSGGYCEAGTPNCVAPRGRLLGMPRNQISIHHRQPRQKGGVRGTSHPAVHSLANLLLIDGTGITACHGWLEEVERGKAYDLGLLVRRGYNPADVPVTLPGGRRVLLHPTSPFYLPTNDGMPYAV
jgi:hypothetical protein